MSIKDFPMKNKVFDFTAKELKYGRKINYEPSMFALKNLAPSDQNMRRFKIANLKNKSCLFEVGVIHNVFFDYISSKNYLKTILYFGNKTKHPITSFSIEYDGDSSCLMWVNPPDLIDTIPAKSQIKQEVIINYNMIPFQTISADMNLIM